MEKNIHQLNYQAEKIKKVKCAEWTRSFRHYVPEYVTDYLFYKFGEVHRMLKFDEKTGYAYDPFIIEQGVEYLLKVVECVRRNEFDRAAVFYEKTAPDAESRIGYFWSFLDKLEVYADKIVQNLKETVIDKIQNEKEFKHHLVLGCSPCFNACIGFLQQGMHSRLGRMGNRHCGYLYRRRSCKESLPA